MASRALPLRTVARISHQLSGLDNRHGHGFIAKRLRQPPAAKPAGAVDDPSQHGVGDGFPPEAFESRTKLQHTRTPGRFALNWYQDEREQACSTLFAAVRALERAKWRPPMALERAQAPWSPLGSGQHVKHVFTSLGGPRFTVAAEAAQNYPTHPPVSRSPEPPEAAWIPQGPVEELETQEAESKAFSSPEPNPTPRKPNGA